ncbi:MAG: alpha-2-macroglobulin family protein [Prolixibacteraceae bacterium]
MKRVISSIFLILLTIQTMAQSDYSEAWKKVDSLQNLGQLQSAREEVMKIYSLSKANNQEDQLIKALLYKTFMEEGYLEEHWYEAIAFTEKEIEGSRTPVRQILLSVLAGIYQNYYRNHSWEINQRTPLADESSSDLTTWDALRFAKTTTRYYQLSLSEPEILKETDLSRYQEILSGDRKNRKYRPTLYDFLAFRAIGFFSDDWPGVIKPSGAFQLDDPRYFGPLAAFTALPPPPGAEETFESHTLKLYQEILRFRSEDPGNVEALVDADLARLEWVHRKSILALKDSLYTEALLSLVQSWEGEPVAADIIYRLANQLKSEGANYDPQTSGALRWKIRDALGWATKCMEKYPGTDGAHNCAIIAEEINKVTVEMTAPKAVVPGKPSLALLRYQNLDKVWFRVIPLQPEEALRNGEKSHEEQLKEFLTRTPVTSWETRLPDEVDYRQHSAEVKIPALSPGYYLVMASSTKNFKTDAPITWWKVWSSCISLVERKNEEGNLEILALDREEGTPLENVTVQPFFRKYNTSWRKYTDQPGPTLVTNARGEATIILSRDKQVNHPYYLVLTSGKDQFITRSSNAMFYRNVENQKSTRSWLFTDRAIYRPGQTLWFKGIVLDQEGDNHTIRKNFREEITFRDVNGQEISSQQLVTNEFGSFSGSFVIPLGGLTGVMSLTGRYGSIDFRVEEYKRPKFEIVFEPVEGAPQLNREVVVKGRASAYAGSKIPGASVTWRVVRDARFPRFWWWRQERFPSSPEEEISSGTSVTGSEGEFEIRFTAIPDNKISGKFSPVFTYTVHATVTDINGETHDARTVVSAGFESLMVSTNLTEKINREEAPDIEVITTNLDGVPEQAAGLVTVRRLTPPGRVLLPRLWERPDRHTLSPEEFRKLFPNEVYNDEDDCTTWPEGDTVLSDSFETPRKSSISGLRKLQPGNYVLKITTSDPFGKPVEHTHYFTLFSPAEGKTVAVEPLTVTLLTPQAEPGETASLLIATPIRKAWVTLSLFSKNGKPRHRNYRIDNGQIRVELPVTESDRGNISIRAVMVRENRSFQEEATITVPYSNKELEITLGSFRDKLQPGQEEEWRITVRDKAGNAAVAELLATLYDASLDIFTRHNWYFSLYHTLTGVSEWESKSGFGNVMGNQLWLPWKSGSVRIREYERLPGFLSGNEEQVFLYVESMTDRAMAQKSVRIRGMAPLDQEMNENPMMDYAFDESAPALPMNGAGEPEQASPGLPPVKARTDFRETAFFFPQLGTNENGEILLRFSMPEALTRWRMMGLAHTADLKTGMIEKALITSKDVMVFPNAPRFLREGDVMEFSASVSNQSGHPLEGTAELRFFDALTMVPVDHLMKLDSPVRDFSIGGGENAAVSWKITVPEGIQALVYRITATAGAFSDGEEAPLPVLTNRMLVTESLPLPIREETTKSFTFDKLVNSGSQNATLRNHRLTLEYTSNPAWYAVQALPYLMEFPHDCAEQVFSRYYANTLATHLANSDPAIRRVFDAWKNLAPDALKSNLEKNEELKAILLQETPWVRDAASEGERKQRIAILLDAVKMAAEQKTALKKLAEMQASEGGWPWFPGMPQSVTITRHILSGIGHLAVLKAMDPARDHELSGMVGKAIGYLDSEKLASFKKLKKEFPSTLKEYHAGFNDIHYLYARSFFLATHPCGEELKEMVDYYKEQAAKYWKNSNLYLKAMTALSLHRLGDSRTAGLILRSLAETALHNEESGMYWRDNKPGWFWHESPIETQALLIEAWDEISADIRSIDEMKVWLLKQKETNDWKSTKATAEAVYALLKRGVSLLTESRPVSITMAGTQVNPYLAEGIQPEPGSGYFKTSWQGGEITPVMGHVTVHNPNPGIAWGALYWQYFEQLDKITPADTPLAVTKELFREINTPQGPKLERVSETTPLRVGDKVVVRVILKTDRNMEYVHLKDMRASAFEPVNVLSGYRWQAGLGYYESTLDAATHFFIDYLPKGNYVFEYRLHATQKGDFSNGITSVQCMYAPQFSAHSEGIRVKVE